MALSSFLKTLAVANSLSYTALSGARRNFEREGVMLPTVVVNYLCFRQGCVSQAGVWGSGVTRFILQGGQALFKERQQYNDIISNDVIR